MSETRSRPLRYGSISGYSARLGIEVLPRPGIAVRGTCYLSDHAEAARHAAAAESTTREGAGFSCGSAPAATAGGQAPSGPARCRASAVPGEIHAGPGCRSRGRIARNSAETRVEDQAADAR